MFLNSKINSELIDPPPKGFFKENRTRLLEQLGKNPSLNKDGIIFLSGPKVQPRYDSDSPVKIWPEPFFFYLFGVTEEVQTYGIIEIKTQKAILVTHYPTEDESNWVKPKNEEDFKKAYEIDAVIPSEKLKEYLNSLVVPEPDKLTIYLNSGKCPTSGKPAETPEKAFEEVLKGKTLDKTLLYAEGREARVLKSDAELKIMKDSVKVASIAHLHAMKYVSDGVTEKQLSNLFTSVTKTYGCDIPYPNIFCAGENGPYLHYEPSDTIPFKNGQLVLNDSAARLHCYCSDITRTFPVNGKFTEKQKKIYNIVLGAQAKALEFTKPGLMWIQSHNEALRFIVNGLCTLKLIKGDPKEAVNAEIGKVFMPHGLGHYIGLYTHDMPGKEAKEPVKKSEHHQDLELINRALEPRMVITVEPGIYFNEVLLNMSYNDPKKAPFLNKEVIEEYKREVGGVRIEDMYVITPSGYEDLSKDLIKTVEDIENYMKK